ncbi:MAG: beta-galactosidase [Phycisphaerales bacterium]|nr:beta-galactosidase [Phycisphaerales bacterium]
MKFKFQFKCNLAFAILILLSTTLRARAHWQTLDFDITQNDTAAYTTNIPADAFTKDGIKLQLKGGSGQTYTLTSNRIFTGDFSFDVQVDIPNRSDRGTLSVDVVLINDQMKRKVIGTFDNSRLAPGSDRASIRYFKDDQPVSVDGVNRWGNLGHGGNFDILRMHKIDNRFWFMQKPKQHDYKYVTRETCPVKENCQDFKVGFVVRTTSDCTATLNIKMVRISGTSVLPRDTTRRIFFFDFGAVNQELEDNCIPVSEYSNYSKDKGFGWVIPDPENVVYLEDGIPKLTDEEIEANGFRPIVRDEGADFIRSCYWLQLHNKKVFYNISKGNTYIDFFKKWIDLDTPLERDGVGMGKPFDFAWDENFQSDVEERRGSVYVDDDLSTYFNVDLPNGRYNVIVGVGNQWSYYAGLEKNKCNVEINGRVRKTAMNAWWRRVVQYEIRDVLVENGQMKFRFFGDIRNSMNPYRNYALSAGWQIQDLVILPAEDKDVFARETWKMILRRAEIIRRVTFVDGQTPVVNNEGEGGKEKGSDAFLSLNGKPFYFLKAMNNYWPGETEHFTWYSLCNTLSIKQAFSNSQHFFRPDWEERSYSDDYPWPEIEHMNNMYTWGYLASVHGDTILSFVPTAVSGEGNPTVDSRGRKNRWNLQPPLNSALGKEIQKEAYTMLANQLGLHPSKMTSLVYDKLMHPNDAGYDDQSLMQYWDWLAARYKTIDNLNKEWGRSYKSFDAIQPTPTEKVRNWQYQPEFTIFCEFRSWAQFKMIAYATDLVHKLEPGHFSWGARGDIGTTSYFPAEDVDTFGWYTPYTAASAARCFGKTPICEGYTLACEDASTDGRTQADYAASGPMQNLAAGERDVYNHIISSTFKGVKGFFNEWQSDGVTHPFHRTALATGVAKDQNGQFVQLSAAARSGTPVRVEQTVFMVQAANQALYRLGPLWLPAKPTTPKILFPTTQASFNYQFNFFCDRPDKDFETPAMRILKSCNLAADFLPISAVKDFSQYQMIVLSELSAAMPKTDAQRLREFVKKGGKLLILNSGGFTDNTNVQPFNTTDVFPLPDLANLAGYRFVGSANPRGFGEVNVRFAQNDIAPEFKDGDRAGTWNTALYYQLPEGSTSKPILTGTLNGQQVVLGLINKDKNVAVLGLPGSDKPDETIHPLARFVRKLIDTWKIDTPITMTGIDDAWGLYAGVLEGPDYRLVTLCNSSTNQSCTTNLQLKNLPAGDYAIIDVTGQHPECKLKPNSNDTYSLVPATKEQRQSAIAMVLSAKDIAEKGIPTTVKPRQAQLWLIRPMNEKVWSSIWPGSLGEFARGGIGKEARGTTIAYGDGPSDKPAAEKIAAAITAKGFPATVVPAATIKLKKTSHEVRIKPEDRDNKKHENPATWPLVDRYDNEVVDIDTSLIVVGSEETNPLLKHLAKENSYLYDKVNEKITASYPGPGRGVIGWVDAVNFPIYDVRSQARDAIVVGGSDPAGTTAAADSLASLITLHAVIHDLPPRPPIGSGKKLQSPPPTTSPAPKE